MSGVLNSDSLLARYLRYIVTHFYGFYDNRGGNKDKEKWCQLTILWTLRSRKGIQILVRIGLVYPRRRHHDEDGWRPSESSARHNVLRQCWVALGQLLQLHAFRTVRLMTLAIYSNILIEILLLPTFLTRIN